MKDDQCCLSFYDLQERPISEVKLSENFVICTWKVRAAFALCTGSLRILYTDFFSEIGDLKHGARLLRDGCRWFIAVV